MPVSLESIEKALVAGDLGKMNADDRHQYYKSVCESLGLNPLTQPFEYVQLNGKLRLYAKKDATDQLRRIYEVSVDELRHDYRDSLGLYIVTAVGSRGKRKDTGTGAVNIKGLTGDALANAIMKAETKAKRRLTLSICGLGMLDETEVESLSSDEPPPDDPEVELAVPESKPVQPLVQIPETVPEAVQTTKEDIINWAKKLKALGVEKAKLLAYVEKNYKVAKTTDLTHEQLAEIVSNCMEQRQKSLEDLNKFLEG